MPLADPVDRHTAAPLQLAWPRPGARMDRAALWRAPTKTLAMRVCFGLVLRGALLWAAR
ncbi:hypothetical protein [Xanthomonas translucens]|uniref:Uncharacterized protein n=2 Tax=Xanthomonas translucens pv. translucens TaxID=134875 RepID=A0A1C3TU59_XANCT|nr:hypothetical protein [Xanthomonas translucens]MCC8448684.1 hypothetical protein [Xanthomonas translucens pv. translucens]MCS3358480.1 hypothetical protein [Xanthomonas translucens pv. translucens]MCT8273786.1 hypothetical protein [Xanthomonas translucens pv. translucens]MCT8284226.1 hypothetical protein [Xanthomonas translucens pv. translucens]MCT8288028.1 hypothetical protein [Xanthomonas translucens pv. translucens]